MACNPGDKFRIQIGGDTELIANSTTVDVCTANKILDRLHREFTEKYASSSGTVKVGKTAIADKHKAHPTFYLRKQPILSSESTTGGTEINRFNNMLSVNPPLTEDDQVYRTTIYGIMTGEHNASIGIEDYRKPSTSPGIQTTINSPDNFKGIYGLVNLNNVLEAQIDTIITGMTGSRQTAQDTTDISDKYAKRREIQTTLQTISDRENEIYREKFLNLILILVGVFLVGTQLVNKYFSFGGGGVGSSGSGGGGLFGNLFTGFGLGASSGIFSRFGGLGLGRSGRSRVTGIFANNPYSLSTR
jgi:hypothetical protein